MVLASNFISTLSLSLFDSIGLTLLILFVTKILIQQGTALRPLYYQFNYEFVNRNYGTDGSCKRHFHSSKMKARGTIRTSENVFDFGRGGQTNITCTYTFTLRPYESLHLQLSNSSFGSRPCRTSADFETGHYSCEYFRNSNEPNSSDDRIRKDSASSIISRRDKYGRSEIQLNEFIWSDVNVSSHQNCICGNSSGLNFIFLGRKIQLTFIVENMGADDSHENFFALFHYEIKKGEGCRGDNHYMKTESGMISLESSFIHGIKEKSPSCDHYPWLLEARENHSLYLRIPGFAMLEEKRIHAGPYYAKPKKNTTANDVYSSESGSVIIGQEGDISYRLHNNNSASSMVLPTLSTAKQSINIFARDRICPTTKNRIFVYDGNNNLVQKICPASNHQMSKKSAPIVEIYSDDFARYNSPLYPVDQTRFKIEFIGRELGTYRIQWLELMSAKMKTMLKALEIDMGLRRGYGLTKKSAGNNGSSVYSSGGQEPYIRKSWDETLNSLFEQGELLPSGESIHMDGMTPEEKARRVADSICPSYCPELAACISESLWCDGEVHCPISLADERSCQSFWLTLGQLMSPAVYIPAAAAVLSALFCCCLVMACVAVKRALINSRKGDGRTPDGTGSALPSACSTVDRRLPRRDYFIDPHDPIS